MKMPLCIVLLLTGTLAGASENVLHLGAFSSGDLTGWKEQTIGMMKPKTTYNLSKDNEKTVLIARSTKSASGRIYSLNLDPKEYQTLKWSWKIDHTIKKGDEKSKQGDDFAARLCVFFPKGFFSKTPAICYVWANRLPRGEHVVSPFTSNIITVAADSGEELAGHWTFHQRNLREDYRKFFGEEPPRIGAVALMTDTDNTGESAVGYYGDIVLVRSAKAHDTIQNEQKPKDVPLKEPNPAEQPPLVDTPLPVKNIVDPNRSDLNKKEQPTGVKVPAAATAP